MDVPCWDGKFRRHIAAVRVCLMQSRYGFNVLAMADDPDPALLVWRTEDSSGAWPRIVVRFFLKLENRCRPNKVHCVKKKVIVQRMFSHFLVL